MTLTPYYSDDSVTIYHGDCREILPHVEADVVVTDPPYGTGGWRRGEKGAGSNPTGSLVVEAWDDGAVDWLTDRPTLTFWTASKAAQLLNAANAVGLTKHRALYMRKRDPKPQVAGRTKWSVEPIWVLSRDGFLIHGGDDICEASTPRLGRDTVATGHPYQKPLEVMTWLIDKTEGSVVDPFMGSGSTLVAAKGLCRVAVGIEAEERYCEIAAQRCAQDVLDLGMAA